MDLLDDIKRELRGEEKTTDDGDSARGGDAETGTDDAGSDTADAGSHTDDAGSHTEDPETGSESVARSTTAAGSGSNGESVASGDETDAGGDETGGRGATGGDSSRGNDHLCSFCETEFDASRDVCPECDAEVVLRGTR